MDQFKAEANVLYWYLGRIIYALDEWGEPGRLSSYSVGEKGTLTKTSTTSSGGKWPCHGVLSSTNPEKLLVIHYLSATLTSTPVLPSGELDTDLSHQTTIPFLGTSTPGPHVTRQTQDHPHGAHLDPTGKLLVIPDLGTDQLRLFSLSANDDGSLTPEIDINLVPGSGPRHVLFSPSKPVLYVLNELENSISIFSTSQTSPFLTPISTQQNLSVLPPTPLPHKTTFKDWHAAELILSLDSNYLYVTNRAENHNPLGNLKSGPADVLAILKLDESGLVVKEDGIKFESCGGRGARHMMEKDKWIAIACHDSDEVVIFERNDDGSLIELVRIGDVGRPGIALWT